MKTILAPTDFSDSSLNAVNYAADLAVSINAKLVLFHAIPFPIAISEISVPGDFVDDLMDNGQQDMDDLLRNLESRTSGKITITTDIKIGTVEQEIEMVCAKERPLAVVLGTRSGKSLERALMGSSVFHIMNHVAFPTLIIPEHVVYREIKHIGMACDMKLSDGKMHMERITEWLSLFNAGLEIINISNRDQDLKGDQTTETISLQTRLRSFKPRFHFLRGENIAGELNDFVKVHPLDLLMVFPRKHGVFSLFHKKKSKFIVSHSQIPILSIHDIKS